MKISKSLFGKLFFTTATLFVFYLSFTFLSAQDFQSGYDLSGGEGDEANFFLQQAISEDNALKTKAEQFNGKLSGVYEGNRLSCPYAFERDLFVGSKGEDVRLLQVLLNSDRRTLISTSGAGSLGVESDTFGEATKEAVKKFQALFIEYTGVANGRFGPRTRTVMNAICNGENKPSSASSLQTRQNVNIYENIFSVQRGAVPGGVATVVTGNTDTVPPRVSLSANVSSVKIGDTFKVILNASEEIVPISPDSIIVEGGVVKEIRKLSKTSYTVTVIINEEEKVKKVLVQVEADKIEDLAGNKNENASNEIAVKVLAQNLAESGTGNSVLGEEEVGINSLLNKIISSAPTCTYNGSGILITIGLDGKQLNTSGCAQTQTQNLAGSGQTYNCNGQQIPITQQCQQQQSQTVCSTTINPYTGLPQQQCQQMTPQQAQAQQAAQQKAMENQQLGQILGKLFGGQGFGSGQNSPGGQFGGGGSGGGMFGGGLPGTLPDQKAIADGLKAASTQSVEALRKAQISACQGKEESPECTTATAALKLAENANKQAGQNSGSGGLYSEMKNANVAYNNCTKAKGEEGLSPEQIESACLGAYNSMVKANAAYKKTNSDFCSNESNRESIGAKDKDACISQMGQPGRNIDAVKERGKDCASGYPHYCDKDTCYDKKDVLLISSFNPSRPPYLITRNFSNKDSSTISAKQSECIVVIPELAPKNYYETLPFTGCATPGYANKKNPGEKDKNYKAKADTPRKTLQFINVYKFTEPLRSAPCPLK
jgi:hypothetical protein